MLTLLQYSDCYIIVFFFSNQQFLILTELEPETTYVIDVAAYSNKGDGERSVSVLAKTFPKPPDAPFVIGTKRPSSSGTEVLIKWRTSASDILSYKLRYGKSLHLLRGRDHSKVKLKEMTFLPQTKEHLFRDLGKSLHY